MFRKTSSIVLACAGLTVLLSGCGSKSAGKVTGIVSCNGKAVSNGAISLYLKGKGFAQNAKVEANGLFTMPESMPIGTYHVTYVPPTPEPQDPEKGPPPVIESAVPKKFEDLESTDVTVEVKGGTNNVVIQFSE